MSFDFSEDKTGRYNLTLAVWTCVRPKKNFLTYDKRMQETDNINKNSISMSCRFSHLKNLPSSKAILRTS